MSAEDPTEPLRGNLGDEAPTEKIQTDDEAPTEPRESWAPHQPSVKSGTGILVASILASLALIVSYIFAGGLDFKPTPVADPCDSRVWTDPNEPADVAQQFVFSTLDGAACDLGVSREELTRALANDQTIDDFLATNDLSREQFDEAIKAGLARAVDDAENAGAIDPLVASVIRTAVQVLPVSVLIPIIQEASGGLGGSSSLGDLLNGDISALDDLIGGSGLDDLFGGFSLDDLFGGSGLDDLIQKGLDALGGGSGGGSGGSGSGGDSILPPGAGGDGSQFQ